MDIAILPSDAAAAQRETTPREQIRGSLLLLFGRLLSLAVNFGIQVLTVRYLSKTEYGAWAYALAVITLCTHACILGLDKSLTRFVPIYQEKNEYAKMFGTIAMMVGTIVALGFALVVLVIGLRGVIGQYVVSDPLAQALLLILIGLAPVQALDSLLVGMLATFAKPRAVFVRKHLLAPGLKLAAVLMLILWQSDVYVLAVGYLLAGTIGVLIYTVLLVDVLRDRGLLQHFTVRNLKWPVREVFGFSVPVLSSEWVFLLRGSIVVLLLEYFWGSASVADFRAVLPVARLNLIVLESFHFLFMPGAARLFARDDRAAINDLYWGTALWTAVLSFPIFAVSFSLAQPLAVLLFGERYAGSGTILAVLSLGYYFHVATGFNALTLRVLGRVRSIVVFDLIACAASLAVSLWLIPRYGAIGGAIGTCATLIVHNILNQTALSGSGVQLFPWRYVKAYAAMTLSAVGLLVVQLFASPPIHVGLALAAAASLLVLVLNRDVLDVQTAFPELRRFRWLQPLLGCSGKAT